MAVKITNGLELEVVITLSWALRAMFFNKDWRKIGVWECPPECLRQTAHRHASAIKWAFDKCFFVHSDYKRGVRDWKYGCQMMIIIVWLECRVSYTWDRLRSGSTEGMPCQRRKLRTLSFFCRGDAGLDRSSTMLQWLPGLATGKFSWHSVSVSLT